MKNFSTALSPLYSFVCQAISQTSKGEISNSYSKIDDAVLWETAKANRIESIIAHSLMDILGSDNVLFHWLQVHEEANNRVSFFLDELDRITSVLSDSGVKVIVIENAAIARAVYSCPGCFHFGDLDLMVCKSSLSTVYKILTGQKNYKLITEFNGLVSGISNLSEGRLIYETTLQSNNKLRINFQWSMVVRRWFSSNKEPDVDTLFKRSKSISNSASMMLSPEDNLFQLVTHNASHGYVRKPGISLHMDVDRFVCGTTIDWKKFAQLIEQYKVKTKSYYSLLIPKELFKTPISDEVITTLKPPYWKEFILTHWLNRVGLFNPHERKFSKVGYIIFTSLLYDDLRGLLRSIFPEKAWMREKYKSTNEIHLLFLYFKRLIDLAFRRVNT